MLRYGDAALISQVTIDDQRFLIEQASLLWLSLLSYKVAQPLDSIGNATLLAQLPQYIKCLGQEQMRLVQLPLPLREITQFP